MAQGNQIAGFLRRLDTGNARHGKHITLGVTAADDHLQGFGQHAHQRLGRRLTERHGFFGDVDHVGATLGIEMSQHGITPDQERRL
ncbi:hypothetical protein D3C81_1919110 [compost metagenome]